MNLNKTEIIVVLDRSGSMQSMVADVVPSFARFVDKQRAEPGECVLTLVQFNAWGVQTVYEAVPIAEVPPLTLEPYGATPLLDALGTTIDNVGHRLRNTPEKLRPGKVIFLVVTDGEENSSTKRTLEQIKASIHEQESKYSWSFVYIGANVDAFKEAQAVGINVARALNYTAASAGSAWDVLSNKVATYRSVVGDGAAASATLDWSDEERDEALKPKA
jgi:uncharacterized protein YegL